MSNWWWLLPVGSAIFTILWGALIPITSPPAFEMDSALWSAWIAFMVIGSCFSIYSCFVVTELRGYSKRERNRQLTQNIELERVEIPPPTAILDSANLQRQLIVLKNQIAELENQNKEIIFLEKRNEKRLAQLKNEVTNLEVLGVRASTSSNLGQVITEREDNRMLGQVIVGSIENK